MVTGKDFNLCRGYLLITHCKFKGEFSIRPTPLTTITAILKKSSQPRETKTTDYFQLGFKTSDGKRVLVVLNTIELGWSGNFERSKMYYYNPTSKRIIKMALKNPERYIGQTFKITGILETLITHEQKYRMIAIKELIVIFDE